MSAVAGHRLGVDVGGTFTDLALADPATGAITIGKVLTTPVDPGEAILAGGDELLGRDGIGFDALARMIHATTLVANTLIQRVGARVALIANEGFVDTLDTGVENRYDMFDLNFQRPPPLVPRHLRFGISERTTISGERLRPVIGAEIEAIAARLAVEGVEAVAVCLLHGFRNPDAERDVGAMLARLLPGVPVTLSSAVAPEIREYARAITASANAYVQPLVQTYLARLEARTRERGLASPLFLLMSEGGLATVPTAAAAAPIRLVESGPAAGAIAAASIAREAGIERAMAFDMGGTTAKLCLIVDARPVRTYTTEVARLHRFKRGSGLPLKIPSVELIEIGAGGGSIAHHDAAGMLRIGPRSAGAVPGPACYGRGGVEPTVTDADLVLGLIDPDAFLGGRMKLDRRAAETALLAGVGTRHGLCALDAAAAVHEMVNDSMAMAARIHAVEHGEDPQAFTLVAFGGAGPVHAWRIASILRIGRVVVPVGAGVMSAIGLLVAAPSIELSVSHTGKLDALDLAAVDRLLAERDADARAVLARTGVGAEATAITRSVECRYVGQAYEVQTPLPEGPLAAAGPGAIVAAFETRYRELYGRTLPGGVVEALTWRVRAEGPRPEMLPRLARTRAGTPAAKGSRKAWFHGHGVVEAAVLDRYALAPGARVAGPALIEEDETTTVAGPGSTVEVDRALNLVIELGA